MIEQIKNLTENSEIPIYDSIYNLVDSYIANKSEFNKVGYDDIKDFDKSHIDKIIKMVKDSKDELLTKTEECIRSFKAEIESVEIQENVTYGNIKTHEFSHSPSYANIKYKMNELIESNSMKMMCAYGDERIPHLVNPVFNNCDLIPMIKSLSGEIKENTFTGKLIIENLKNITDHYDMLLKLQIDVYDNLIREIPVAFSENIKYILRYYFCLSNICKAYILVSNIAVIELIGIVKKSKKYLDGKAIILNESYGREDVSEYVKQLNELIPDLRKYYDSVEYKDILEPRKKHIDKMHEYLLGALQRKYTLKIPIYKILNFRDNDNKEKILRFIDKLNTIVKEYHNFYLITPNMKSDEEDLFIYITLKEPFGEADDNGQRVASTIDKEVNIPKKPVNESYDPRIEVKNGPHGEKNIFVDGVLYSSVDSNEVNSEIREIEEKFNKSDSMNESALSKEERDKLDYKEFALPNERKFPIHDEAHIKQALRMYSHCPEKDKITFIRNICVAIRDKKLVGKVTISKKFKDRDMFPVWMYEESRAKLESYTDKNTWRISYYDEDGIEHKITTR